MAAASMVAATSCSDFDDYNKDPLDISSSANKTLWENISENSNLSDFASLLKKAGFDKMLSQPTFYTVFAPLNGTFDASALAAEDSATLRDHFAENHIAYYNHQVTGAVDERIKALNEKSYNLKGQGSYTFGDVALEQTNLPSVNGIMHTLNGEIHYYPNVYEYISQSQGCDSVASFFKHYEHTTLDVDNSTLGPVVNGRQTYIDSVLVTTNDILGRRYLNASLENEDSSYTMMMPSDKAWIGMYNTIKPYFNYINKTIYQEGSNMTSLTDNSHNNTVEVNAAYYSDSLTKMNIAKMLLFNNNNRVNQWVENGGRNTDSIMTSGREPLYILNPTEFLKQTKEKAKASNGYVRYVDSLAVRPWDTFAPEVISLSLANAFTSSTTRVRVDNVDTTKIKLPFRNTTSYTYIHAAPTSNYSKPSMILNLPMALSHAYNLYVVLVPPDGVVNDSTVKPNQLDFEVSYCNANGTIRASQKLRQKVENNPLKVDTVYAGRISFPVCYYGLGTRVCPNLKITTDFAVFNRTLMAKYTRDIRIAAVIMRPVEYDDFLGNKH